MGKHLTSEQIEQMRAYKAKGHTQAEVGQLFGVSEETARKYCKGISPMNKLYQFPKRTEEQVDAVVKRYNGNLTYHSGFTKGDCTVNVQCTICGNVFQRSIVTLRHGRATKACPFCYPALTPEQRKQREREKGREKARRKREKDAPLIEARKRERHERALMNQALREKQSIEIREARRHDCPICGTSTTRPKYCSNKCSVIANTRKYNSVHEARRRTKLKAVVVDRGITLKKLYDRDGGRCWICGLMCDYTDKTYTDKTMIAGNMYPSIDHVVALKYGGTHSWENVRLAHRICNTLRYWSPPG